jgi:hypothetical protein
VLNSLNFLINFNGVAKIKKRYRGRVERMDLIKRIRPGKEREQ